MEEMELELSMVWVVFRQRTRQGSKMEACILLLTKQGVWVETARVKYKTILYQMVESLGCHSRPCGL